MKFNPKRLMMLSPDADDWNNLVKTENMENTLYGVLLYPREGISRKVLDEELMYFMEQKYPSFNHGTIDRGTITERGRDWAVPYTISSWYNHFDLNEQFD